MELPNPRGLWTWGVSLGPYSLPYDHPNGVLGHTLQGEMVNNYKYDAWLLKSRREAITRSFTDQVFTAIYAQFHERFPNWDNLPFDVCLGPPENRDTGHSLPREVCSLLAQDRKWIGDGFSGIRKTRSAEVMKNVPRSERAERLKGLYEINKETMPYSDFGFLIIDDVFETGASVSALCETLQDTFPRLPRFVVALTHLYYTERSRT
jgi:hypothetical protein